MTAHRLRAWLATGLLALGIGACRDADVSRQTVAAWPPKVGQPFPDMTVLDHEGHRVLLSSFRGKVLLVEPIGMSCAGCIGFCGGEEYGAFEGVEPQQGLASIDEYFERFADGADIDDPHIAIIQMLFFNLAEQTPTIADAGKWARHFQVDRRPNHHVLIGPESLRDKTYPNIPGYWLVDKEFVLRSDATGHHPPSNLYSDLLPMLPELLHDEASVPP